jgi:aspartate/glutamate racemase
MKMNKEKNKKTVFIIHTSDVSVSDAKNLFKELAPNIIVRNIIDDSLLPEVLANDGITKSVTKRICTYAILAEIAGADLIFNQCSSVGEAADIARELVSVPLVKVDEKMAEIACQTGKKIGVIATLKTTLGPTVRLIEKTALKLNKEVKIIQKLCEGAFDKLIMGDKRAHNEMVINAIHEMAKDVDLIVCAQGSMIALLPELNKIAVPVLTSPRLGVERAVEILNSMS